MRSVERERRCEPRAPRASRRSRLLLRERRDDRRDRDRRPSDRERERSRCEARAWREPLRADELLLRFRDRERERERERERRPPEKRGTEPFDHHFLSCESAKSVLPLCPNVITFLAISGGDCAWQCSKKAFQ